MDFLDPKKRKAHQIRLYIGYGLMAVLVGMIAVLMLFQAYGYTYDLRTGDISQNGLLFVNSHPIPATLTLNGQVRGEGDQKLILPAGNYSMQLNREGYREWRRDVVLGGGEIERFVYPFLFPNEPVVSNVRAYGNEPALATQSPDRQWLLVQVPGAYSQFDMIDLNQEEPVIERFSLPDTLLTTEGEKHTLTLVEWSTDNRHVVLKHVFETGSELLLVDRVQPSQSRNLTKEIPVAFSSLKLRDKRFDSYYLHQKEQQSLYLFDLGAESATLVQSDVITYQPHGDDEMIFISDENDDKDTVEVRMVQDGNEYIIKTLPTAERYVLDIARFENKWYMAAGSAAEPKVYVLRNPVDALNADPPRKIFPASILRMEGVEHVAFSQNARFLAVQAGSQFAVYDAEESRNYRYDTELKLKDKQKIVWMDGHRLTVISEGKHVVFDYDGTNMQTLSEGSNSFIPYYDRDYTAAYTITPPKTGGGGATLLRTSLIVEE